MSPVKPAWSTAAPSIAVATACAQAGRPGGATSVSTNDDPAMALRSWPKRSVAAGLQAVMRPSRSIVNQRPSSSQPVTSAESGRGEAAGSAGCAVSSALITEGGGNALAHAPMYASARARYRPPTGALDRTAVELSRVPRLRGLLGRLFGLFVLRGLGDERGLEALLDRLLGHDALLHVAAGRELELHVEERLLEDRPQAARAGLALERLVGDRLERLVGEDELDVVELEEAVELLRQRVLRLGEDRDEVLAGQLMNHGDHRQAADELGDQPVLDEVL